MAKTEAEFHHPEVAWRRQSPDVEGITERVLSIDPETGDYTRMLRFAPGADSSAAGTLTHTFWEEVYILEGSFTDLRLGQTFVAGMYACRPPGMPHGPWRSEQGVTTLEIRYGLGADLAGLGR